MTMIYTRWQRVRFTADNLGVVEHPGQTRFLPNTVSRGDVGAYWGPNTYLDDPDWHFVAVHSQSRNRTEYVPVHESMFEAATREGKQS